MSLTETEAEIILKVASLGEATKEEISKGVGFSLAYIDFLCRYLARKGYLFFSNRRYSLTQLGIKTVLREQMLKDDRDFIKEIAFHVASELKGEIEKTLKGIELPLSQITEGIRRKQQPRRRISQESQRRIEIKTDFNLPIKDESLALESNLERIGVKLEEQESDIERKIESLRRLKKLKKT